MVVPTAGGKSFIIALAIQRWKMGYHPLRVCVLAHRKELVDQNSKELMEAWPAGDIGVYSAGLGRRQFDRSILYASIDSIWNKGGELDPFDVVIVDEAHRIPARGEGKYRSFIKELKKWSPHLRVIGFTATPFRMEGPICHRDHILQEIAYEIHLTVLLAGGYVCPLKSRISDIQPDMEEVRRNGKGDYIEADLAAAVDKSDLVSSTVAEMMRLIRDFNRKSIVVFCVDVAHCEHVSQELRKYGIQAPFVTAKTPAQERDRLVKQFKGGRFPILLNINVYTEGFNAKAVDCVVLLRPTLSKSLYVQMVGRGLRLHPNKDWCLILDFAGCIAQHGPIDQLDTGHVTLCTCGQCGFAFSRSVRVCPECGWVIPPQVMEKLENEEKVKERRMHSSKAGNDPILSEPVWLDVDDVSVHLHRKLDKPDSLRVQYRCGLTMVSEWICLNHDGIARRNAVIWWKVRRLPGEAKNLTVADAISDLLLPQQIKQVTKRIKVVRSGKFFNLLEHDLSVPEISPTHSEVS